MTRWVWVTGPHCYADADGRDRAGLDPATGVVPDDGWWRCHRETREGDAVLLYRTRPRADLAYLLEARSDAFAVPSRVRGAGFACRYEVLEKVAHPVGIAAIRDDPALAAWGARRSGFQGSVFRVPDDVWDHLLPRLVDDPAASARLAERARRSTGRARAVARLLGDEPARLAPAVGGAVLHARTHRRADGPEVGPVLLDGAGRRVVVQVERGPVGAAAVVELASACAQLDAEAAGDGATRGLLVGVGLDEAARALLATERRLAFTTFDAVGLADPG